MKKLLSLSVGFILWTTAVAQVKTDFFLKDLLLKNANKYGDAFNNVMRDPAKYRVQIVYTQINRDAKNRPRFTSYGFRLNPKEYFYPASTVKFPACLLALEKINALKINELDKFTPMLTDSCEGIPNYPPQYSDETAAEKVPSIAHYIKKILVVSDNDAFNRLYELVNQQPFNDALYQKGYKNLRIVHRLSIPMSREQNRTSNPIHFVSKGREVYNQKILRGSKLYQSDTTIAVGKGYMRGETLVNEPFDFTAKNYFALEEQQKMLRAVLFPDNVPASQRFNLTKDDYKFLYQYMSQSPLETTFPPYAKDTAMYDSYCKFLMFGDKKTPMPKNIRIFNKVGDAYGFLIDNAYIVDFQTGVEFMLSATIYCNNDGIFNDDKYDYDNIGFPFMGSLGRLIYDYELTRLRPQMPDFQPFKVKYDRE